MKVGLAVAASLLIIATSPASVANEPAAPPPTDAASKPPEQATMAAMDASAMRKMASGLGLKPRTQNGVELYCKSFAEIGTRLATMNCYTKEQVVQLQKRKQSNQDDVAALQRASLTEPNLH